ncbi:MAG TPA: radical SAM protein [Geobacteraceae bacterium]|nr:radical SAM protein [Geobacteraceae bacterium]
MSWKIIEKYRRILAAEKGTVRKNWGGKLPVCLVYPNRYRTAMSNLGFQAVYALLNSHSDIVCERAFLPDPEEMKEYAKAGTQLLSLESQRPLADFGVISFSVSFESDYLHIPAIFRLAGIPPFAAERDSSQPLIMAGGASLFLNPEPVAEFMDLVCIGEAEAILPALLALLQEEGSERQPLLRRAAQLPGIYVPSLYEVSYDGPKVEAIRPLAGAPGRVSRVWAKDMDDHVTASALFTPDTEFSDMHLIELSRGCPRGCRFCAAGFIYRPYRQRSLAKIREEAARGLGEHQRLGLVGAAITDYHGIGELCRFIIGQGGKVSVSSLRLDNLDDELLEALKASGHKTVSLAPEGGSQRLRDLIKKDLGTEQILAACDRLIRNDILNLKLYFIIGLPTETMADLEEMTALVTEIRARVLAAAREMGRIGEVTLSVNPFVPKPFTPLQWCGMEERKSLEGKIRYLQQAVGRLANVRMIAESPRDASLQALLSRGDRRLARLLASAAETGNWRKEAKALGIDTEAMVCRAIPLDETLPWDVIDSGNSDHLVREYRKAIFPR